MSTPSRLTFAFLSRLIAVMALLVAGDKVCAQVATGPRADFLRVEYGAQLPARYDGGSSVYVSGLAAASTGDGGWLTCWSKGGND